MTSASAKSPNCLPEDAGQPVMVVLGTRPEAIKLAPIISAISTSESFAPIVVSTGQHREMLTEVLGVFGLHAHIDLNVMQHKQTLPAIASRVLRGIAGVIQESQPAAILVQGDTTSTLAAALAAAYCKIPLVHVEAGLRTGNRLLPFPEEINRCLTAVVADLHLAPTKAARCNLLRAGIDGDAVLVIGNSVIDALQETLRRRPAAHPALDVSSNARTIVVTSHRRESWGDPMREIAQAIRTIACRHADCAVIVPMHKNPIVRECLEPRLRGLANVLLTEPLPYDVFSHLLNRCSLVLTDSGGIQEEAPALGKPVLVLRDTTERPEGVVAGTARLVGRRADGIADAVSELLSDDSKFQAMARAVNPYGDGNAADRTVQALKYLLCGGPKPAEFAPPGHSASESNTGGIRLTEQLIDEVAAR